MSQENVEIVRSVCERWANGDFSSAEWADPDIVFVPVWGRAESRGLEALARRWREDLQAWDSLAVVPEELVDLGERVLVRLRSRGRGKGSGAPIPGLLGAAMFTLRAGKVVRLVLYADFNEAFEAAGLSGEASPQRNLERLRAIYAQPMRDVAAILELCDPEIEVTEPPKIPDASTFRGHQGLRAVLSKLEEVFPDMRFAAQEFVPAGDRVLVCMEWRGTGAGSGASSRMSLYHLWTFRNDRAVRINAFLDRKTAFRAAGLAE